MTLGDERIQIDHLDMAMKRFEDCFPTDTRRQGGDRGEVRFFRHDVDRRIPGKWLMRNHYQYIDEVIPVYQQLERQGCKYMREIWQELNKQVIFVSLTASDDDNNNNNNNNVQ